MKKLHGTGVALITPFDQAGKIDYKALSKLLRHTVKNVNYYVITTENYFPKNSSTSGATIVLVGIGILSGFDSTPVFECLA